LKTFEERKSECDIIRKKYPNRIPIIVIKNSKSDIPDIDKNKFLVPNDLSIAQFLFTIRKRIKLRPEQSLFLFVKNTLPRSDILLQQLYKEMQDEDGFLYITYSGENTFG
jgi:GABA(A) receptor-associated protein